MKKPDLSFSSAYSVLGSINLDRILPTLGIFLLVFALSVFFGLLATTAHPILVSLGVGVLIGGLLILKPTWNIWLILVLGLLVAGVLPIWVEGIASKMVWGISMLGFILMVTALFNVVCNPEKVGGTPSFVWLTLTFVIFTLINGLLQWSSFYEFSSGFKRYYQVTGLLFGLAWFSITERQVQLWRTLLIIVALSQLPWAIYQLIELVPIRESQVHAYPGMVPVDVVAGTFGASMYGGGSTGDMATFLIVISAFLMARRREKLIARNKYFLLLGLVLVPLFLGETKVVLIFLPLMFLTLYRFELITHPKKAFLGLLMGILLTIAIGYVYLSTTKTGNLDQFVIDTWDYNFGEIGYGGYLRGFTLNRTSVLTFWVQQQSISDPVSLLFGNGLGAAHEQGHIAVRYKNYGVGFTAIPVLLWEQGLVGATLFMSIFAYAWYAASRLQSETVEPWVRADASAIQAAIALFTVFLFYRVAMLEALPLQIIFYGLLGYLAWLHRRTKSIINKSIR